MDGDPADATDPGRHFPETLFRALSREVSLVFRERDGSVEQVGSDYATGSDHETVAAGLLVAPDLVLTCGSDRRATPPLDWARFSTAVTDQGRSVGTTDVPFAEIAIVAAGSTGDTNYRLPRLPQNPGRDRVGGSPPQTRGWLYLDPNRTASPGDGTYLLRHSSDGQLQFVYRDDSIAFAGAHLVRHRHDAPALAGAPIVANDWAVVALRCGGGRTDLSLGIPIRGILDDLGRREEVMPFKTPFQIEQRAIDAPTPG